MTSSLATAALLAVKMLKSRDVEKLTEVESSPLRNISGWWSLIGETAIEMEQVWVSERLVREIERRRGERDGSSALEKYVRLLKSSCGINFRYYK